MKKVFKFYIAKNDITHFVSSGFATQVEAEKELLKKRKTEPILRGKNDPFTIDDVYDPVYNGEDTYKFQIQSFEKKPRKNPEAESEPEKIQGEKKEQE